MASKTFSSMMKASTKYTKKKKSITNTPIKYSDYSFGVNADYINNFSRDADSFFNNSRDIYNASGYSNTKEKYNSYQSEYTTLDRRAKTIKAFRDAQQNNLNEKALSEIDSVLNAWKDNNKSFSSAYENKISEISQFENEEDYKRALKTAEYTEKYGNMTQEERKKALNNLKVARAEDGKIKGDDEDLDSEIDFLEYYGERQGYGTSAEYDKKIRDLVNKKAEIEELYVKGEPFSANEHQRDNTEIAALSARIGQLEQKRDEVKAQEAIKEKYSKYTQAEDFETESQYVSTVKNLSDEEIEALGYKKNRAGQWYKDVGLGGVEYYEDTDDPLYEYINADTDTQEDMMMSAKAELAAQGQVFAHGDWVKSTRYKTYGEMSDEEVKIYNYLYKTNPDNAQKYLDELLPSLNKRFDSKESERLAQIGYDSLLGSSLISIATNFAAGTFAPVQIALDAVGADGSILDSASQITSSLRAGAGKKAGELWDAEIPIIQKNAGEFVYGSLMSLADMGVAIGTGAAMTGGGAAAAKATQFIMSSEAAASAVYNAHEEGLSGLEVAARGVLAGAIEAITEKYSIENILADPKGILKGVLTQAFTEATEESAATLLNSAVDVIASEIFEHANEIEKATYNLIGEGMSAEEASREAFNQYLRDLGTDALAGALTGALMGGGKEVPNSIVNAIDKRIEHKEINADVGKISKAAASQLESLGETGDIELIGRAIAKQTAGQKLTKAESKALSESKYAEVVSAQLDPEAVSRGDEGSKWAKSIGTTRINAEQYGFTRDNKYTVTSSEDGGYTFSQMDLDGNSSEIDLSEFDVNSPERKISEMAKRQKMSPATVQTLVNGYNNKADINDYVEEAEYVYSMGKAGIPSSMVSRGAGLLSNTAREMLYSDGSEYTRGIESTRDNAYAKLREATSGVITAGNLDTSAIKGMKLNATQKRNVRLAEALTSLGFNIKIVREVTGNKKALGSFNEQTGVIEVNINASKKNVMGAVRGQFLSTLSHEITHQMKKAATDLYSQYCDIVLRGFEASGELDNLLENEIGRLRKAERHKGKSDAELLELAKDEIVARASEDMLRDSDTIKRIIEENRTVGEKILEVITKIVDKLREVLAEFEGEASLSEEARLLREMLDVYEDAKAKWSEALAESVKNIAAEREAGTKVDSDGEVVYSEGDVEVTLEDVETLRNIGRKSINKFTNEDIKKAEPWARKFFRELGVKSPFFRAWFGDWREFDKQTKASVFYANKTEGKNPRGIFVNNDTGWAISSSSVGYDETISHSGRDKVSVKVMRSIDKVIENSILLDTEVSEYGRGKKGIGTMFSHKFYSIVSVDGKLHIAKMAVDESFRPKQDTSKKFYHVRAIEISPAASVGTGFNQIAHLLNAGDTTYSISDLFSLVKRYDKNFNPKPASRVVNSDGTPKIMYHGSPNQFTVFDKKRSKPSNLYGRGFYFSDSNAHAGTYGEVYEVYLNVKNPLSPNKSKVTEEQIRSFLEAVAENEDYSIENYGTYDVSEILSGITSRDAFAVIQDINATSIGDFVEAIELFNEVNGTNYDGIITDTETVVFSPTQVKSATDNIGTFDGTNPDIRYSESDSDTTPSMRETLIDALAKTAQNDAEREALAEYKVKVKVIDEYNAELDKVNAELKKLSFGKGKRNTGRISELKGRKAVLEAKIQRADKKLLKLEATKALNDVLLRREKQLRAQKADALKKARADAKAATTAELNRIVEEERAKARAAKMGERMAVEAEIADIKRRAAEREIERRTRNTRNTVKERASNLVSYITNQTDKKNVKEGIKGAALEFLRVILKESGMFTPSEMRHLRNAYANLSEKSNVDLEYKGTYTFEIMEDIESLEETVSGRAWRDLTLEELERVDRVTANLRTMIRTENKIFRDNRAADRVALAEAAKVTAESSKARESKGTLDKLLLTGNITPTYFFKRIGGTFEKLFRDIVEAQNVAAKQYNEAKIKLDELKKKYNFKSWYNNKATRIATEGGDEFNLTAGQAMYIYAVSKRETPDSKTNHLRGEGVVTEEAIKKIKKKKRTKEEIVKKRIRLTEKDISNIIATLTDEQKDMADELVAYLSNDMSMLGNEVSMKLFGIKKYNESYYIPLKVSSDYIYRSSVDEKGEKSKSGTPTKKLKEMGSSHSLQEGADQPLVAADIFDIWAEHVIEMANYNAFVLPIEAFESILNFRYENDDRGRTMFETKYGENALDYLETFIRDLNGGAVNIDKTGMEKFVSLQKKAKVAASISVWIQQPLSIMRAAAVIDPKYLRTAKRAKATSDVQRTKRWDLMKKYAPGVTVTKEMGKFDIGSGASAREFINPDKRTETAKEKGEKFINVVDNVLSKPAEWGDRIAWMQIWNACEAEVSDKTDLKGEAFYKAVGERFTEVINKTQVYDSVISRSAHMRNKNPLAVQATAFKAEPTLMMNVLIDAYRAGDAKQKVRATAVYVAQTIINAALVSLVYAARDDDKEKTYLEKYVSEFASKTIDEFTLLSNIPFLSDAASTAKGYDSGRMELELIATFLDAFNGVFKEDSGVEEWIEFGTSLTDLIGVPAKNIFRDAKAIINLFVNNSSDDTTAQSIDYAIREEFANSNTDKMLKKVFRWSFDPGYTGGMFDSLDEGDYTSARKIKEEIYEYEVFCAKREAEAKGKKFDLKEAEEDARVSLQTKLTKYYKPLYIAAYEANDHKEMERIKGLLRRTEVYKDNISNVCKNWVK